MKLWNFDGGLHLDGHKAESTACAIRASFMPSRLVLPLQQHIGEAAEVIVSEGDHVLKGQMLARAHGYVSVPLHAPTSGTITQITEQPVPHPSGLSAPCILMKPDGKDQWAEMQGIEDYSGLDPSALRNRIRDAGVVGLGGAGFPSFIKLNPGGHIAIESLIINAAECEPYITCDDMLMRERPEEIIQGIEIMRHAVQARQVLIGIEDNKPEAATSLENEIQRLGLGELRVIRIPTRYPAGGEKQLIRTLTGKEVPSHGLPLDIGVICHNVATAAAIYRAVILGQPLLSRIITVTGRGISDPANYEVLVGTPIAELIEHCGGYQADAERLIMGGPMMGFTLHTDQVPIIKTSNCILVAGASEFMSSAPAMPCIRCGACVPVCPARLLPQQLYWHAHAKDFDKAQDYNLFDCIECGCCAYVCPSHIPLVQYYRFAKTEIWTQEREKQKSDLARKRHEFRLERLEREKLEREEARRKKKAALHKDDAAHANDGKKSAIEAALARVQDKKRNAQTPVKNVDNLTPEQQQKIAEVEARRAQQKTKNPKQEQDNKSAGEP